MLAGPADIYRFDCIRGGNGDTVTRIRRRFKCLDVLKGHITMLGLLHDHQGASVLFLGREGGKFDANSSGDATDRP